MKPKDKKLTNYWSSLDAQAKLKMFMVSLPELRDFYSNKNWDWALQILSTSVSLGDSKAWVCWDCAQRFFNSESCEEHILRDHLKYDHELALMSPKRVDDNWLQMIRSPTKWVAIDDPSEAKSSMIDLICRTRILGVLLKQFEALLMEHFLCEETCVRILSFCKNVLPTDLVSGPETLLYLPLDGLKVVINFLRHLACLSTNYGSGEVLDTTTTTPVVTDSEVFFHDGFFHLTLDQGSSSDGDNKLRHLFNPSIDQQLKDWKLNLREKLGCQFLQKLHQLYSTTCELCSEKNRVLEDLEVLECVIRECVADSNSEDRRKSNFKATLSSQLEQPHVNAKLSEFITNILQQPPLQPTQQEHIPYQFASQGYRSLLTLELGQEADVSYNHFHAVMLQEYLQKDLKVMELNLGIYQMMCKFLYYEEKIPDCCVESCNSILAALVKYYIRAKIEQVIETTEDKTKASKRDEIEEQPRSNNDIDIKHNVVNKVSVRFENGRATQEEDLLYQGMTRISLNNKRSKGKKKKH